MLGSYLRQLRQSRGMAVSAVAKEVGVSRFSVYYWETTKFPEPQNLQRLLDHYGATESERLQAWELLGSREEVA